MVNLALGIVSNFMEDTDYDSSLTTFFIDILGNFTHTHKHTQTHTHTHTHTFTNYRTNITNTNLREKLIPEYAFWISCTNIYIHILKKFVPIST